MRPGTRKNAKGGAGLGLFRRVVEAAPNAIVVTDRRGRIALVNSQAEKLFGYARREIMGKSVETLVPVKSRAQHVKDRTAYSAAPQARAMGAGRDLFGLRKDGVEIPLEIGLSSLKTEEGDFILASIIDISERKRLEARLRRSEALATMGRMVAVVSHEIRNPLGSIIMAARALVRGDLGEEDRRQVLSVLSKESQRLNETLEDFLQYARPREPKMERGDLNATTHDVLAAVRSDKRLAGDTVIEEILDKRLGPMRYDEDQIRQVLWNIILNGFQAMGGKGRLEVRTEAQGDRAAVHVKDTGPGISVHHLERIFEPFYTTKAKGTGLGLSISRNIVVAHGGDIVVESGPGAGTRFSIVLPISKE